MSDHPPTGEFSVYRFYANGTYEAVDRYVDVETAQRVAFRSINSVGAKIGTIQRVLITDGMDLTAMEWLCGKGIVFPLPASNGGNAA